MKKEFKPDHSASSVADAFGVAPETIARMHDEGINAYNSSADKKDETPSMSIEATTTALRNAFFGKCDSAPSAYEMMLFHVAFDMGRQQVKSVVHHILSMGAEIKSVPKELVAVMVIGKIIDYMKEDEGKHDCTKCGKCGKKFDEDGNEIEK